MAGAQAARTAPHAVHPAADRVAARAMRQPTECLAQQRRRRQLPMDTTARRFSMVVQAIGFDLPGAETGNKSAEKHAEELTRSAASLLLYSSVLKGKPAQAFLSVLQLLQKGNPLALVQAYCEMYRLLAAEDHATWQDYLLDQVIRGTDSPLARAAAAGKPTAHLRSAAAHDLDVLQQLAVLERTLAGWVKDSAYGTTDRWFEAAASLVPAQPGGGNGGGGVEASGVPEWLLEGAEGFPPPALLGPLSKAEHAALRAELEGKWRWSEGIELLERYHAVHGYGLVSQHSVLTWTGKLQAQDALRGAHQQVPEAQGGPLDESHPAAKALAEEVLADFLSHDLAGLDTPPHVALCGPATKRWLYTCWALQQVTSATSHDQGSLRAPGSSLRTLILPAGQLSALADLAWTLSQHPRARFVVVANGLGAGGGPAAADVAAMLSGYDGFSWPVNAVLVAGYAEAPPADLAPVFKHTLSV